MRRSGTVSQAPATATAASTTAADGSSRRARREKKSPSRIRPVLMASRTRRPVIRYPEMTKKTSTPMNPPARPGISAWKARTARTATARSPSMSGRNADRCGLGPDSPP
ncbi:hypothetical protein SMICM304S_10892 [Streptomyces microflavus]